MLADQDPLSKKEGPGGWRLGWARTQLHANNRECRQFWKEVLGVVGGYQSHLAQRTEADEARGRVFVVDVEYPQAERIPEHLDVLEMVARRNGGSIAQLGRSRG
jgi:hypothetical protein